MTDTLGIRTSDQNVASHRRLVYNQIIRGLEAAFDENYTRDRQLIGLKITPQYPLEKIDYPAIVVTYENTLIASPGVGHEEWFSDPRGNWRKWYHSRFEGTLSFDILALSPFDRDILADALIEVIRFGRLEPQLNQFYEFVYPIDQEHVEFPWLYTDYGPPMSVYMYQQLMLDSDQIQGAGDSATIAAWAPEDVLVFSTTYTVVLHGGYYNVNPTVDWHRVTRILLDAYEENTPGNDLPFPGHAEIDWEPPFQWHDDDITRAKGQPTGVET